LGIFSNVFGGKKLETGLENAPATGTGNSSGTFQVVDVFEITGVGVVPVGIVLSGTLKPGQTALVNGKKAVIKTMEMRHQQLQEAQAGANIGINLVGVSKGDLQKGMVLGFG